MVWGGFGVGKLLNPKWGVLYDVLSEREVLNRPSWSSISLIVINMHFWTCSSKSWGVYARDFAQIEGGGPDQIAEAVCYQKQGQRWTVFGALASAARSTGGLWCATAVL